MIKLKTIGMIEKNAKGDPTVIAHAELKNGALHTIANGKTAYPVVGADGAVQTKNIRIALNTNAGDAQYTDPKIASGAYVNSYLLPPWDGQELVFDESHITYGESETYASIAAGTTKLLAGNDGNFKIASSVNYHGVYFEVAKKVQFNGNGVVAKIVVAY